MAISLAEVIKQTRLRHPAFTREAVPNVVLGEGLSTYQRELIKLSADRLSSLVVDRFTVMFSFGDTDPAALLMTATDFGVVTGVPALVDHTGAGIDLVDGAPAANLEEELTGKFEDGLVLPDHLKILEGTVFYPGGTGLASDPTTSPVFLSPAYGNQFRIVAYDQRFNPPHFPSGYVLDEKLYLTGSTADWNGYQGIDVRYVPLPVNLVSTSDTFRVPEICREALNAHANLIAAKWCAKKGLEVSVDEYLADKDKAEFRVLEAISDRQSKITRTTKRNR